MVTSIIDYEGKHTISKLNHNQFAGTDVSNDIKFIRDTNWEPEELLTRYRNQLKQYSGKATKGILIIDDSVIEKRTGTKHMEGLLFHYSHTKGRSVYGHCIVSSHYRIGNISVPYDFDFYLNEYISKKLKQPFRTKVEIAQGFIEDFQPISNEQVYVAMDSWYTSEKIITTGLSRGFHIIGALKTNRVFRFHKHGMKHKLSKYVSNLQNSSFETISLNGEAFMVRRIEVYLNGTDKVVIVISKRKKDRSIRCILSTDMTLSNEEILRIYSHRWDIEVGYLYLKDRLGLGHYQMRKLKAIKKYCALVIMAFGLLEVLRVSNNEKSIGQSRRIFSVMKKRTYIDQIIELSKRGVSKREIYKHLKLVA